MTCGFIGLRSVCPAFRSRSARDIICRRDNNVVGAGDGPIRRTVKVPGIRNCNESGLRQTKAQYGGQDGDDVLCLHVRSPFLWVSP